jgi:hypothetical protein
MHQPVLARTAAELPASAARPQIAVSLPPPFLGTHPGLIVPLWQPSSLCQAGLHPLAADHPAALRQAQQILHAAAGQTVNAGTVRTLGEPGTESKLEQRQSGSG